MVCERLRPEIRVVPRRSWLSCVEETRTINDNGAVSLFYRNLRCWHSYPAMTALASCPLCNPRSHSSLFSKCFLVNGTTSVLPNLLKRNAVQKTVALMIACPAHNFVQIFAIAQILSIILFFTWSWVCGIRKLGPNKKETFLW